MVQLEKTSLLDQKSCRRIVSSRRAPSSSSSRPWPVDSLMRCYFRNFAVHYYGSRSLCLAAINTHSWINLIVKCANHRFNIGLRYYYTMALEYYIIQILSNIAFFSFFIELIWLIFILLKRLILLFIKLFEFVFGMLIS